MGIWDVHCILDGENGSSKSYAVPIPSICSTSIRTGPDIVDPRMWSHGRRLAFVLCRYISYLSPGSNNTDKGQITLTTGKKKNVMIQTGIYEEKPLVVLDGMHLVGLMGEIAPVSRHIP
jgi:hypothetical protein